MGFKTKVAVATMAVAALFSGSASAALSNAATGNSSLMLTVWDTANSYTRDLGTTLDGFLSTYADSSLFNAGDALFTSTFSDTSSVNWNIVAADSTYLAGSDPRRVLSTGQLPSGPITANGTGIGVAGGAVDFQTQQMNANGCNTSVSCAVPNGTNGFGGNATWGNKIGGGLNGSSNNVGTGTAQQLGMFLISQLSGSNFTTITGQQFSSQQGPGTWTLAANGDLQWNNVVPVPAAVWLLASGLLGLAGVARRKQQMAAA